MNPQALYLGLYPMAALSALFLGSFGLFALHWFFADGKAGSERGFFVAYFYALIDPICRGLAAFGISPNVITIGSLFVGIAGAIALGQGEFILAAWLVIVASSADAVDGYLARHLGVSSDAGAFLDSYIDRLTEGAFFLGFAYLGGGEALTYLALLGLIGSFSISYARARGESLGASAKVGIMQRPVRLALVSFAIFGLAWAQALGEGAVLAGLEATTWFMGAFAAATLFTSARRARFIFLQLADDSPDVESIPSMSYDEDVVERAAG